jgi:hypothetical protein
MIDHLLFGMARHQSFKKTELILHILLFICGWDLSAVVVSDFNLRLTWLFLPILFFFTPRFRVPIAYSIYIYIFFIFHSLSALVSGHFIRGFTYSLWVLFSYYFFFVIGFRCTRDLGEKVFKVLIDNGRIQIVCAAVIYFMGLQERAHLFYYEPSYMAIALIPYVASVLFGGNRKYFDFLLILLFLVISQSGNFVLVLMLASICKAYTLRDNKTFFKVVMTFGAIFIFVLVYVYLDEKNINHRLIVAIWDAGISWDALWFIIERGGNRIPRMQVAFDVLSQNLFFGIGPSNFISHIQNLDFSHITNGIEDIEPYGKPPTNILIEAGLNSGLFGLVMIVILFSYFFIRSGGIANSEIRVKLQAMILIFILMLQLDSNYLRAYVWVGFGVAFAFMMKDRRVEFKKN